MAARVRGGAPGLTPPLAHPIARALLIAFALLHIALAASGSPGGPTALDVLALVLLIGAAAVVVLVPGPTLPPCWTGVLLVAVLVACGLKDAALPVGGWPGYAAWHLGAATFVLLALALRNRVGTAWLGMVGIVLESIAWSVLTGQGVYHGVDLVDRQAGTLLIGTLFAVGLARASDAVAQFRALEQDRVTEQRRLAAAQHERAGEAGRLLALIGPTLALLETVDSVSPDERASLRALEGHLRDRMLAPQLQDEMLVHALAEARGRGVDIALLSDLDPEHRHPRLSEALEWLTVRVAAAHGPTFVGRVTERGGALRVSAVVEEGQEERLFAAAPEDA